MELFYAEPENFTDAHIVIHGEESNHISNVIRKSKGDEINVTNGKGGFFICKIEEVNKRKEMILGIIEKKQFPVPNPRVTFLMPILKNPGRIEFMLEKLTELGIMEFQPYISERTVSKSKAKMQRWHNILISAMKQSNHFHLPVLKDTLEFEQIVEEYSGKDIIRFMGEIDSPKISQKLEILTANKEKGVVLTVGPEGDFSPKEISLLKSAGFQGLNLGSTRLRSETAAIVLTSIVTISV